MAYKNAYGSITGKMSLNAGALDDLTASANDGALTGVTLSVNGVLNFANATDNVTFTRSDYEHVGNDSFAIVIIHKNTKNNADVERLHSVRDSGVTTNMYTIYNSATETMTFGENAGIARSLSNSMVTNTGKWIVSVISNVNKDLRTIHHDGDKLASQASDIGTGNLFSTNSKATVGAIWNQATGLYEGCGVWDCCFFANISGTLTAANVVDITNEFNMLL